MKVAEDDLRVAAEKAEHYNARIESIQEALHAEVAHLLSASPTPHTRAVLAAFTRFDSNFSRIQDSLDDLHRELITAPAACEHRFDREAL